ncbi:MAG: carbohydrate kinase family protein [Deinococcus sp.]|nr:carbohydrate kinase family protein [Deinococcus sp.]
MSQRPLDVACVGYVFCDLIFAGLDRLPDPGQELYAPQFDIAPGAAAITATGAARLNLRTALVTTIGQDALGDFLVSRLRQEGIDLSYVQKVDGARSSISVAISLARDRCFVSYSDVLRRPELHPSHQMTPELLSSTRHVHLAGLSANLELSLSALERARNAGASISADIGWDSSGRWDQAIYRCLELVDIFLPNETEAVHLTRKDGARAALSELAKYVAVPVVKLGAKGAMSIDEQGEVITVPTLSVTPLDTTGAGDAFDAGFLYGYLKSYPRRDCLALGNICGALSVTKLGGATGIPREAELLERFRRGESWQGGTR